MANNPEALRNVLQLLGDILAELAQRTSAVRAAIARRRMRDHFARKVLRQRLALAARLHLLIRLQGIGNALFFGLIGLELFQLKLHLLQLSHQLLALAPKYHVPELINHQLQTLDLLAARLQFAALQGEGLKMRVQLGPQGSEFLLLGGPGCGELFLLSEDQRRQSIAVERLEIGQRLAGHEASIRYTIVLSHTCSVKRR
jgi:hypothetical protein